MKSGIRALLSGLFLLSWNQSQADELREKVLRNRAIESGLVRVEQLLPQLDKQKSAAGKLLFESKLLSLTQEIACQNCHLDQFASADGIPLGIGTKGGSGSGIERMKHGGDMLPRNTLPFWGRGGLGFNTFFWDGRVDGRTPGKVISQFGDRAPSEDPLVVAAHLPVVQIKEMVADGDQFDYLRQESLDAASIVYRTIADRVAADETLSKEITAAFSIPKSKITYKEIAESLATFIRDRFQLKPTRLQGFVFDGDALSAGEIQGGLIFYGRGKCVSCHSGPYFTDFDFHAIAFSQFGRGMNGFGVDYGRYNVTSNPADMYKFRTPPLYNVLKTSPYGHSGSVYELKLAIAAHTDPLVGVDLTAIDPVARSEFYQRLAHWAQEPIFGVQLDEADLSNLVAFLGTLSFDDSARASLDEGKQN